VYLRSQANNKKYSLMSMAGIIVLIALTTSITAVHASEIVWVSSKQTHIYQDASLDSGLLTVLQKNDAVEVLDHQGIWLRIRAATSTGWVSRYSVSFTKPYQQKVSIFALLKNFFRTDNKRARLTLVSTAGGVRGLTEEQSDAIGKTDFAAVKIMESIDVSEVEIDAFIGGRSD